jgi:predicted hydrolase (HD superfamily)
MEFEQFRELFLSALQLAIKNAETNLGKAIPQDFIILLHGAGHAGNEISADAAAQALYIDENHFYRIIDVAVQQISTTQTYIFVRVSGHPPASLAETVNYALGYGAFKQLLAAIKVKDNHMDRSTAWDIVCEFVQSDSLRKHMLSVECAMRAYAAHYGEDADSWGLVGLLHDFDWEIHPTLEQHPMDGAPILRERGASEEDIRTILSHGPLAADDRVTLRDKALFAVDELTGLITAAALVRPSKNVRDVEVSSIRKKWKDKAFARGVNREDVEQGAALLGVDLWEFHVPLVLKAMQDNAESLGLQGVGG